MNYLYNILEYIRKIKYITHLKVDNKYIIKKMSKYIILPQKNPKYLYKSDNWNYSCNSLRVFASENSIYINYYQNTDSHDFELW